MNTWDIAAEYRLSHWAGIVRERAEKGVSVRLYCREAGIHENTYFYWQRKLREAACTGLRDGNLPSPSQTTMTPGGWAELSVQEDRPSTSGLTIVVKGCQIQVAPNTDMNLLARVCQALQSP